MGLLPTSKNGLPARDGLLPSRGCGGVEVGCGVYTNNIAPDTYTLSTPYGTYELSHNPSTCGFSQGCCWGVLAFPTTFICINEGGGDIFASNALVLAGSVTGGGFFLQGRLGHVTAPTSAFWRLEQPNLLEKGTTYNIPWFDNSSIFSPPPCGGGTVATITPGPL